MTKISKICLKSSPKHRNNSTKNYLRKPNEKILKMSEDKTYRNDMLQYNILEFCMTYDVRRNFNSLSTALNELVEVPT